MWRWLIGPFVAHGLIHAAIYLTPTSPSAPIVPAHSWVLSGLGLADGTARSISRALASVTAFGFVLVGVGLLTHQDWWRVTAVLTAAVGLVLLTRYCNPWLSLGLTLNAAMVAALLWANWPSEGLIGA